MIIDASFVLWKLEQKVIESGLVIGTVHRVDFSHGILYALSISLLSTVC